MNNSSLIILSGRELRMVCFKNLDNQTNPDNLMVGISITPEEKRSFQGGEAACEKLVCPELLANLQTVYLTLL